MTLKEIEYRETLKRIAYKYISMLFSKEWYDSYIDSGSWLIPSSYNAEAIYLHYVCPKLCKKLMRDIGLDYPLALLFCLEYYHIIYGYEEYRD